MIEKYCKEEQSRLDKEKARIVDVGIGLNGKYGWTRVIAFLLEVAYPIA